MIRHVDIAVIGAGSAGLSAVKELQKHTQDFVVIDRGPLGTTCSRVGCMPSKALLQIAHDRKAMLRLQRDGICSEVNRGHVDTKAALSKVRKVRDHFVDFTLKTISELSDHFIQASARFLAPNHLALDNGVEIKARAIIIATGGTPVIPREWQEFGDRIVTTDTLFERTDLDGEWAVIGAGPLGLEMSQALAGLGLKVTAFNKNLMLGGLKDKVVHDAALKALREDFPIVLGGAITLKHSESRIEVHSGQHSQTVDLVLAAVGRKPNLAELDLSKSGCKIDHKGLPVFNKTTMKVEMIDTLTGVSIYIAGDVDGAALVLHEAADDGRIAGYNATHERIVEFKRRTKLSITFTSPTLASVGQALTELDDPALGEASFENQGRSVIMGENRGKLQIYADKKTGKMLGAELAAPAGEHLAHQLALAIDQGHTVAELLEVPVYHPTVEEGLRTALRRASRQLEFGRKDVPSLASLET